jgi:DNA-3-methyladenine glycosylase I
MTKELKRCPWPGEDPLYRRYHDEEWGVPEYDDRALYEKLMLDGFQAGLSWITILRKRAAYRQAFAGFDIKAVAAFDGRDVRRLLNDAGIVRNRQKIEAAIANAQATLAVRAEHGTLDRFLWSFTDGRPVVNRWTRIADVPAETDLSRTVSRELRQRGFRFVGPTIVYAFMQAAGMVNDHLVSCFRHRELTR